MTREEFRAILVAHDACASGLADYDAASDEDVAPFLRWSMASQLAAIQGPLRKYVGWAWAAGVLPAWALRWADLTGADLTGADLTGADLTGANLAGAYLARADLARANLEGADLARANLTEACLTGANLAGANLTEACLTGANLTGANLRGAVMPSGWEAVVAYRPDGTRGSHV